MEKAKPKEKSQKTAKEWELRLYVAGQTPKSLTAFANLKKICEDHLAGEYHIEVIDLLKNPQLASGDQILAIPDPGQETARAHPQDHRGPLEHGACAGRIGYPGTEINQDPHDLD